MLLSFAEVVSVLPIDPTVAGTWLRDSVRPDGHFLGEPMYTWASIASSLTENLCGTRKVGYISTEQAAEAMGVSRRTLDRMLTKAPPLLAGAPVRTGRGSSRTHLRWKRDEVSEWLSAYHQWDTGKRSHKTKGARKKRSQRLDTSTVDWSQVVSVANARS